MTDKIDMKKLAFKLFKKSMNYLPTFVLDEVVRRTVSLPQDIPEGLIFKIAETEAELEASFQLVYDSYLKLGYCSENPYKMRATIYHALSTTTTLLALDGDKVVGTLTVVRDNVFKLPMEKYFDVSRLRDKAERLAEITSMVIHPDYRREKGGSVLFTLLRFMHEYGTNYFGVDHLVVTVHPKDAFFYKSLLLFDAIPGAEVDDYLGAPAVALELNLRTAYDRFKKIYSKRNAETNLFDFFVSRKIPNLKFPEKLYKKISHPMVSISYFEELFVKKLGLGDLMSEENVLGFVQYPVSMQRKHLRIDVELPTTIIDKESSTVITGQMKDVSRIGFRVFTDSTLPLGMEFECRISLNDNLFANVTAKAQWSDQHKGVGFNITKSDAEWDKYIDFLYLEQYDKVG